MPEPTQLQKAAANKVLKTNGRAGPSMAMPFRRCGTITASVRLLCSTPGELTVRDLAARLGVDHGTVISWINQGLLSARRGLYSRWCVPFGPEVEAR